MAEDEKKPEQEEQTAEPENTPQEEPKKQEEEPPKKQVLSVKEIDELYEEIKQASKAQGDDSNPDKEKELVKKAIEAERKRIAQEEAAKKDQEEKQQMKSELESMKAELENLKNTSGGRRSKVAQESPFERTEDNKIKVPKKEFDAAVKQFVTNKR